MFIDPFAEGDVFDDEFVTYLSPGFIENWDKAVIDVALGKVPKAVDAHVSYCNTYEDKHTTNCVNCSSEISNCIRNTIQHNVTTYPTIIKTLETGISEIYIKYELFCPWCGCKLVLKQNSKTKVVFYGCSGYPHCKYSIGEDELKQWIQIQTF